MTIDTYPTPVAELAAEFRRGERDPAEFADELCDRIEEVDPDLHSLVSQPDRERLREVAAALESRFPDPEERPPLYGVPVGVKDIIHAEGFTTRAGSALPPELFAGPEAGCVTRLRDAGALVLGKTVTTEFAGAAPGLTRNPHDLDHTPGGSSSGSAAGVAAGLFPLALGTQTVGSVIRPASFCGVVGMKPSFERIPRDGVLERSESADHVGMFTQDLAGMELAASALCDDWADDAAAEGSPAIGVPEGDYLDNASEEALEIYEAGLSRLEDAGCTVRRVTVPTFEEFEALKSRHRRMTNAELAMVHEEWFDDWRAFYRTPMAEHIEEGREIPTGQLAESRASRLELREELESLLDEHDLDLWAAPAAPGPAPETIQGTGDPVMNNPWTHSGLPVVTLPAGEAENGLPLGIQFAAPYMEDERLLALAGTIDEAL